MRFYSNENFPYPAVEALREAGHDVLTSYDAGKANQRIPDDEVLVFAKEENRVLLTFNRKDFIKLHNDWPSLTEPHAGILVCKRNDDFPELVTCICEAVSGKTQLPGELIRVNRPN